MRDSERYVATTWDCRDSESQPVTIGDSERHVATLWDKIESERQLATTRDSEKHVETQWDCRYLLELRNTVEMCVK